MKRIATIALLASLSLVQACLSDGTGGTAGSGALAPLPLEGQIIACQEDADCVVVELGCCDSCNGGWSASVNKDYEEDVSTRNRDACSDQQVCTEMACDAAFPRCENNTCTSRVEDWQSCETDADCAVVELGCCDHCNGGSVMACRADHVDDVLRTFGAECAEDYACTLMACAPYLPTCSGGMCIAEQDPDWGIDLEGQSSK
jgi:hypothetical protein